MRDTKGFKLLQKNSGAILVDETERKPNLYAANVLAGIVAVIVIVCFMNEVEIFILDKIFMRICLAFALVVFFLMQCIVHGPLLVVNPASKYVMMSCVLLLVFTVNVLLNIHAVLALVLPLLLAAHYRSHSITYLAIGGAAACCLIAPVLSYVLGTWNLTFMTGYIQTFCKVTIEATPGNMQSFSDAVWQILLYWSMPQCLILLAFGLILFSTTKSGIDSVKNQMQVADLSNDLGQQLLSIQSMQEQMLISMSEIIEGRDIETGGHVRRTSEIVRILTNAMLKDPESGVTETFCFNVIKSAPMHDLGKIAVPDILLRKPGRLTDEEFAIIKRHPVKSAEILEHALTGIEDEELLSTAKNIALYHHERVDGSGYPEGLAGDEIPLEARIMAIADVYDALMSERYYKAALGLDEAFQTIEAAMGTQFDAKLNPYFLACREQIEEFYKN